MKGQIALLFFVNHKIKTMAVRRLMGPWQKYLRFAGLLLVFILFVPIIGAFLTKSMQLVGHRKQVAPTQGVMPMMDIATAPSVGEGGMGMMGRSVGLESDQKMMRFNDIAADSVAAMPVMTSPMTVTISSERKLAKSASLDLRAKSLAWTSGKIQEIVKNVGGYVENANVSEPYAGMKTGWMSVRVPSDRFDTVIGEVKQTASAVVSESLNTSDVTDQSIDLEARLKAKQAEEAALVNLLNRAEKVSDVIEITSRLTQVRAEIEQLEAGKRSLDGQVAMSSLSISITEDPKVVANTEPVRNGNVFKRSLADLYQFGIALGSGLVMLTVSGLPVVIVYGLFFWALYRFGRFVANRVMHRKK